MTVCEMCKELCDGLGPYCADCKRDFEEFVSTDDSVIGIFVKDEPVTR